MRAVQVAAYGGPEVLDVVDLPDPTPRPGELLVDVHLAGVNFVDTYHRTGLYPVDLPVVPGQEGVGRVAALGGGDTGDLAVGDRVVWANVFGGYAERVAVPAGVAVRVPEEVPDDVAVGAHLQGMTAHLLVTDCAPVGAGDTVLVHAAAGGVGLLLTQLAVARGARVLGTVSTAGKERLARAAGAAEVLRPDCVEDLAAAVRALTRDEGVAVAFDGVGRDTFDASLASLRRRGTLVLFGASSGPVPPVDPLRLLRAGSVYLTRPTLGDFVRTREELVARAGAVFTAITDGHLAVRIGHRYPLDRAARAHADLEGRRTTGKVLLIP